MCSLNPKIDKFKLICCKMNICETNKDEDEKWYDLNSSQYF